MTAIMKRNGLLQPEQTDNYYIGGLRLDLIGLVVRYHICYVVVIDYVGQLLWTKKWRSWTFSPKGPVS